MNKFDYKNLTPFKWFVLENFPFIEADFDALTEWQIFCKLGKEINKIIDSQNIVGEQAENLTNAFNNLKNYVDNYFDNLDVQDEINNKLNEMAKDGSLTDLIKKYIDPLIQQQNNIIEEQNNTINNINNTVQTHASQIANLVANASDTEGNSELIDIRVGANGNTYTSAGESVREQITDTNNKIINEINLYNDKILTKQLNLSSELFEIGGIDGGTGVNLAFPTAIRSKTFLNLDETVRTFRTFSNQDNKSVQLLLYSNDGTFERRIFIDNTNIKIFLPYNAKIRIVIVNQSVVTNVAEVLSKVTFEISCMNNLKSSDIFDIQELNLIKNEFTFSGSIDETTGKVLYNENSSYATIYTPVNENENYYMSEVEFYTAFFNDNNELIGKVHKLHTEPLTNPFTIPVGATYMLTVKSKKNIGVSSYINQIGTKYYDENDLYVKVKDNIIAPFKPVLFNDLQQSNILKNKSINVFGDSISSTDYTMPYWGDIIASNTGCVINNYGISGTTLAHTNDRHLWDYHFTRLDAEKIGYVENDPSTWSTGNCFCERFTKVDTDADAIVIMGGTNDGAVPLGTWDSTDTATFYGALNTLFTGISKRLAGKKIIICTPIQTSNSYLTNVIDAKSVLKNSNASNPVSLQIRAEAIKEKCKQFGLHCIDLYNDSGINGVDTNKIYYRSGDPLHPSSYGQIRLASLIQNELEKLFTD